MAHYKDLKALTLISNKNGTLWSRSELAQVQIWLQCVPVNKIMAEFSHHPPPNEKSFYSLPQKNELRHLDFS
jgi:hypothetical protein